MNSTTHKQAMKKIRTKLTRVIMLQMTHCGHEGPAAKAMHEQFALEDMIEHAMVAAYQEGRRATPTPPC